LALVSLYRMAGSTMFSLAYGIKVESISDPLLVDFESAAGAAISAALPGAFLVVRVSSSLLQLPPRYFAFLYPHYSSIVYYTTLNHFLLLFRYCSLSETC
jgi:hypothetical protein